MKIESADIMYLVEFRRRFVYTNDDFGNAKMLDAPMRWEILGRYTGFEGAKDAAQSYKNLGYHTRISKWVEIPLGET
jgi:hypothetical protein